VGVGVGVAVGIRVGVAVGAGVGVLVGAGEKVGVGAGVSVGVELVQLIPTNTAKTSTKGIRTRITGFTLHLITLMPGASYIGSNQLGQFSQCLGTTLPPARVVRLL